MITALTPELYTRLEQTLGSVKIANEGEELAEESNSGYDAAFSVSGVTHGDTRRRVEIAAPGEYYRVNCPICQDTRHRLWVNHRFQDFPYAVICYNESCYDNYANRQALYDLMFRPIGNRRLLVYRGHREDSRDLQSFRHPGQVVPVRSLTFDHPLRSYLLLRSFDPDYVSDRYAASFCYEPDPAFPTLRNRLVFPVMFRSHPVGWQGRFVGEADWHTIPKYFAMPGQWKRYVLYNYDRAVLMPWVVLVEGATDVWRIEDHAMAVLGGTMSSYHKQLIAANFQDKPLGVMFDGDDPAAAEKANDTYEALRVARNGPVFLVTCPQGMDPGKMSKENNFEVIHAGARAAGIYLP